MDSAKLENLIKSMEPTEDCLVQGLLSWVTNDDIYWRAILAGSVILLTQERGLREHLEANTELAYFYSSRHAFISIPESLFAGDIPEEIQKEWIILSTPILKTLGCFWRKDKSPQEIVLKDEQPFVEALAKQADLESYLRSFYRHVPKDQPRNVTCVSCKRRVERSQAAPVWLNFLVCRECREGRKNV